MARLSLYLLGLPRVEQDGKPIDVDTRKAVALLAYLATTGTSQRRDHLISLFWPEYDSEHAFATLRRTLSVLRSALAGDWLVVDRETIALPASPDVWLDVDQFHSLLAQCRTHGHPSSAVCPDCLPLLTQAAALHRGDYMSSFGLQDSPDFDDWQVQQGEALRSDLSKTLEKLAQGYAAQGDLESAITYARRELALDRLNEAAHAQLMRLYAWSGRRPAALQQYHECVKILQEQLGVSPQDWLTALHDALRSGAVPPPPALAASRVDARSSPRSLPALAAATPATPLYPAVTVLEEKRLVTVLAAAAGQAVQGESGLKGEDEAALVQRFVRASEDILRRYGGHSARAVGGSVLAVFGAARTRESDPELAIRAALEMEDEARKLGLGLSAGISTGEVYASRSDVAATEQPGLVGRAIDIALRLAVQAEPGQILVAAATQRASRGAIAFTAIEVAAGAAQPTTVYQVKRLLPQPVKARGLEDMRATLTGRDDEMTRLTGALERACLGRGQMVSLIGEAGVGKSRLVAELKEYALGRGMALLWLEGRCLEMGVPASYAPFLDILGGYFAGTEQNDDRTRRNLIASRLRALSEEGHLEPERAAEIEALLCRLLSGPVEGAWAERLRKESAEQIRQRTFSALCDFVFAVARERPLVLVFEDLHWADDLSLDLIALLVEGLGQRGMLLLCAYRPEPDHTVGRLATVADQKCRECYSDLHLRELTQQQSRQLLASLVAADSLPTALEDSILSRAQGNPFFIEEMIRSMIDGGVLYREDDHWRARADFDSTSIPDSVQAVILSRVDQLGDDAKRVMQTASVIGRLFRRRVLEAASEPGANLDGILADLAERTLVYQERAFPEVEYSFKHVLMQQAVYQNILTSRRSVLHRRVAETIEALYPDNLADYAEQLAFHYEQSGDVEKAVDYLLTAGEKAKRQYANTSAVAHFNHALGLLTTLPESRERAGRELDLLLALGSPLIAMKGSASTDAEKIYSRARELALKLGDTTRLSPALHGLHSMQFNRAHFVEALSLARELMDLAEASQEPGLLLEAHRALAGDLYVRGDLAAALAEAEQGLVLFEAGEYRTHSFLFVSDPGVLLLRHAAWSSWILGYPDQAQARARRLLALAEESAPPIILGDALVMASFVHQLRRDVRVAEEQGAAAIKIGAEHNYPLLLADGLVRHGWAISWQGKAGEGIAEIQRGMATVQAMGHAVFRWSKLVILAEACSQAGRLADALAAVDEALILAVNAGAPYYQAEIWRLRGDVLLRQGSAPEAEDCFLRALEIARRLSARGWELRASTSLARLWRQQGKPEQARTLLQGVYGWFTEGFDTPDLQDARALLDALAP